MQHANTLSDLAKKRILILDGAMGTAIQQRGLSAEDFTLPGDTQAHPGCNEVLTLSRPDVIGDIHTDYINVGADIIETNTFGANTFSLKDYGLSNKVYELNFAAAKLAKACAEKANRPIFIAGDIGPTGRSASFSPSVDDPAYRESSFKDFVAMYREQIKGLLDAGIDLFLVETIFDTLVAKAALTAIMDETKERGIELPIMVSATFSDKSRRTLSGQELEAFITSISSYPIFSLGINCSTGVAEMIPLIKDLAKLSPFNTSAHPNAGFPDNDGKYMQTPQELAELLRPVLEDGSLNIVGGCCGTRPEHIAAIAKVAQGKPVFEPEGKEAVLKLSAWDTLRIPQDHLFITVGERANVAGSRKFARLIKGKKYEEAISITRKQIEEGAQIIDICMDEAMIDAPAAMKTFLRLVAADPVAARVPVMIDSSSWEVIETALSELQGRSIVNSISLKEGEEEFLRKANFIHDMGAVPMVMLFDEQGQADTFARKCAVARRAYTLLSEKTRIAPESIIFDPNILSIATGIEEHDLYARDFIRAVKWIKEQYPLVKTSGGLSNLSFAFRGNNPLRKAMHTIFLELAVEAGLDMAIVNPAMEYVSADIPESAKAIIKEALLVEKGDGPAARQALIDLAMSGSLDTEVRSRKPEAGIENWRTKDIRERLSEALVRGDDSFLEADLDEAGKDHAMELIEGPLMGGMSKVGVLFGEGKVFLPQVVRSARIMKKAVGILRPYLTEMDDTTASARGTIVLATVKGDVHDIGKNIVSLVLQCNHFRVIDLGVMVPPEDIFKAAVEYKADMVGLSGLITPSLVEMGEVCHQFQEAGLDIPIMIGGATTSEAHTATRLAPIYPGHVVYTSDASDAVRIALELASAQAPKFLKKTQEHYSGVDAKTTGKKVDLMSIEEARELKYRKINSSSSPTFLGTKVIKNIPLGNLLPRINWKMFALAWQIKPKSKEAEVLQKDAEFLLHKPEVKATFERSLSAVIGMFNARPQGDDVLVVDKDDKDIATLYFLRQQEKNSKSVKLSLSDYVSKTGDYVGLFVATAGTEIKTLSKKYHDVGEDYHALLVNLLADRLAEACSEYLQIRLETEWWKQDEHRIIRPASGYPSVPDHSEKGTIFKILGAEKHLGISLTESYAMDPVSSVCGYYFADVDPHYFSLGTISGEQFEDYARRKGRAVKELKKVFAGKLKSIDK
ncbi:MAG: methionine synthase [Candidatus Marinimicrobia bacterium]|nr:methionine synthase [Candidatus Neomarinimicrobiota bacterium]